MPVRTSTFQAPWWLRGPHLQTIWSTLIGRRPALETRRERLELPDGDFVDLDWAGGNEGPIVLVLHGLEGSIESPYARGLLQAITARGWRGVLMHFRGCSETPNRLPRAYHSGDTGDIAVVVAHLQDQAPHVPLLAAGYSLGGNVLLKWLGEQGDDAPLAGAVAVSVPFDLSVCADRLDRGLSRLYQWQFVRSLKASYTRKQPLGDLEQVRTIRQWDDQVTAPIHDFTDAEDYYTRSSNRQFLRHIRVPTLILHAADDPFMSAEIIPTAADLSDTVTLEVSQTGGHVGFIHGSPGRAKYWLESRIPSFFDQMIGP